MAKDENGDATMFLADMDTPGIVVERTLDTIDTRDNIAFRYYETGSPFEYELVRLMYLKMREIEIAR